MPKIEEQYQASLNTWNKELKERLPETPALNPEDYEHVEGEFECEGCSFESNFGCLIALTSEHGEAFARYFKDQPCWDEELCVCEDDHEEVIYYIYKLKS